MVVTTEEIELMQKLHKESFKLTDFVRRSKPNIEVFLFNEDLKFKTHYLKKILALYTFGFWTQQWMDKVPNKNAIRTYFAPIKNK